MGDDPESLRRAGGVTMAATVLLLAPMFLVAGIALWWSKLQYGARHATAVSETGHESVVPRQPDRIA